MIQLMLISHYDIDNNINPAIAAGNKGIGNQKSVVRIILTAGRYQGPIAVLCYPCPYSRAGVNVYLYDSFIFATVNVLTA